MNSSAETTSHLDGDGVEIAPTDGAQGVDHRSDGPARGVCSIGGVVGDDDDGRRAVGLEGDAGPQVTVLALEGGDDGLPGLLVVEGQVGDGEPGAVLHGHGRYPFVRLRQLAGPMISMARSSKVRRSLPERANRSTRTRTLAVTR